MKTIIAGSRVITDYEAVNRAIAESGFANQISEVVSGRAKGVDTLGEEWALRNGVPCRHFPAAWQTEGRAAGPLRNEQMALYAEALIAVWDGMSRGSRHMIELAQRQGLRVHISVVKPA